MAGILGDFIKIIKYFSGLNFNLVIGSKIEDGG